MVWLSPPLPGDWPGKRPATAGTLAVMTRSGLSWRLLQLYIGLACYGLAGALQVRSRLGLDPWDVLHQGISRHVDLAIGTVVIAVGAAVLLLWIPLRQRPGLGTVSNVVLIGVSMNLSLQWLPHVHAMAWRVADLAAGIVLCGLATGMYIGAHFGPGPRDGLMTGLARRSGRSIRLTRTCLELTVLVAGWLLGGTVGLGHAGLRGGDRPVGAGVLAGVRHPGAGQPAASVSSSNSSPDSSIPAAAMFSSRCATDDVPGIGSMTGERRSSQASAS